MQPTAPTIIKSTGVVMPNAPAKAATLQDGVQVVLKVSNPIYAISTVNNVLISLLLRVGIVLGFTRSNATVTVTIANMANVSISEMSDGEKNRHSAAMADNNSQKFFLIFRIIDKQKDKLISLFLLNKTFSLLYHPLSQFSTQILVEVR
jgi:hypothetical protein